LSTLLDRISATRSSGSVHQSRIVQSRRETLKHRRRFIATLLDVSGGNNGALRMQILAS
jgi:hypothetical protein